MGRHTRTMFFVLLVMLLALTGCEKKYTGGNTETASDTETQTEIETEKETNPETVRESVESDKVTESSNQNKKVFESSLGYSVIYDDTVFEYNRTGDYDEIGLKGQTFSSKPVFFAAMKIKNEDIPAVMDQVFSNSVQQTTIGVKDYSAVCQPTTEEVDGGKELKYHNQYLVELANGDALLFEVQWFEDNKNLTETETANESADVKESENIQASKETVKDTETASAGSKEEIAESASRKLAEMLDSIEIEVPVKGEEPAEALETVSESGSETQQTEAAAAETER